jgi:hypothetical protein
MIELGKKNTFYNNKQIFQLDYIKLIDKYSKCLDIPLQDLSLKKKVRKIIKLKEQIGK